MPSYSWLYISSKHNIILSLLCYLCSIIFLQNSSRTPCTLHKKKNSFSISIQITYMVIHQLIHYLFIKEILHSLSTLHRQRAYNASILHYPQNTKSYLLLHSKPTACYTIRRYNLPTVGRLKSFYQ